ncbi:MAG: chemotaxis protein methyltransferase CheR [Rhizobacter sp.]|nr:chemotaxis protein methyltransferase CheR [Rhizobacter sp.]
MDPSAPTPTRIVIADDNRDSADALGVILEMWGYGTTVTYDGIEAVEATRRVEPDVVILDINMPRMTGNQAAVALRADPPGQQQPLILVALTAETSGPERMLQVEAGFDAHVGKPIDLDLLQRTLSRLLEGRRGLSTYMGLDPLRPFAGPSRTANR